MDELKKYLQQHADALDQDEPGAHVWHRIQRDIPATQKPHPVIRIARWAVAACILLLAGIGTWHLLQPGPSGTVPAIAKTEKKHTAPAPITPQAIASNKVSIQKTTPLPNRRTIIPDLTPLRNIESSFTQVINLQKEKVSTMPLYAESPAYFNDFKVQLKQMEKDEKQIKADILKRGMNDDLLDQLINLYQQKLTTLKQLQTEMTKLNNRYKKNRGPADTTTTYFLNI